MKETPYQIISVNDGDVASPDILSEFMLDSLCTNGKISFVGFINKKNKLLVSCPKHFVYRTAEDIKLIVKCIIKSARKTDKGSTEDVNCNIPYRAYIHVVDYYNRFGFYKHERKKYVQGYSGNIDWNRTIRKSQKILSDNSITFLPFEIRKTIRENSFIGECMKYVINDGYEQFGKYVGIGERIEVYSQGVNFRNAESVIRRLNNEIEKHFKDTELQLIYALILYFKWSGSISENSYFVTQSFDLTWENMVQNYLNKNYAGYNMETQMIELEKGCNRKTFNKKTENVESDMNHLKNHRFRVEYDHLLTGKDGDKITVFDSKYYGKITELNYKQVAYHYFLMNQPNKKSISAKNIINGLILPTSKEEYYSRVHVDRRDVDGVYIQEHFFNIREVMKQFV